MLYGLPPPAPRELADSMRELFVKREKLLDEEHCKFIEHVVKMHKDVEYGIRKNVTGEEVQEMLERTERFLKALGKLYQQIEERKELENILHLYESTITIVRDVLKLEGIDKISDEAAVKHLEEITHKGVVPERYLRIFKEIKQAKKDYDAGKLTASEVAELQKNANEFFKFMVEHIQRKRAHDLDRSRIRVRYGQKLGEAMILDDYLYLIMDVDAEEKEISKSEFKDDRIRNPVKISLEELEHAMANAKSTKASLNHALYEELKRTFGADMEIMLNL
jgi:Skp family chaperone for outer membrane proteins